MHKAIIAFLLLATLTTACASRKVSPSTDNAVTEEAIPSNQPITHRATWIFTSITSRSHQYRSITNTSFQHDNLNGVPDRDTVTIITDFTIQLNQSHASIGITGDINKVETRPSSRTGSSSQTTTSSLGFSGAITDGNLTLKILPTESTSSTDYETCNIPANAVLGDIRAVLTAIPPLLLLTSKWTDTVTTNTCTGSKIPSELSMVRSYSVVGETNQSGIPLLLIRRTETTHLAGAGSQGQHQVTVKGEGSGTADLYLDQVTGSILLVNTHQNLKLTVSTSGRNEHFNQIVNQEIRIKP